MPKCNFDSNFVEMEFLIELTYVQSVFEGNLVLYQPIFKYDMKLSVGSNIISVRKLYRAKTDVATGKTSPTCQRKCRFSQK